MRSFRSWVGRGALGFAMLTANGCGDSSAIDTVQSDADATDGDAPDAGADTEAGGSRSCVSVTGGGLEPWLDLQIAGHQFDAYEGRRIRVVAASQAGWRLGVAEATITSGAFALTLPATINYGYYEEIALYVDDNADDACDVGEPLWGFVSGIVQETLVVEVTPDGPCISGGGPSMVQGCHPWPPSAGACVINGQADLTLRLPCAG